MNAIVRLMSRITNREEGQTLTEYGLLLFFIAVVAIVAIVFLGEEISTIFSKVATSLSGSGS